jgi:hypothetical protein
VLRDGRSRTARPLGYGGSPQGGCAPRYTDLNDPNDRLEPDVPVSRKRKKASRPTTTATGGPVKKGPSPRWLAPLMLVLFGIGVLWLVTFYITQGEMPVASGLGNANLLVGFGFIIAGFALSTQWR